jgi:Tfp pilus assembly protein PilF
MTLSAVSAVSPICFGCAGSSTLSPNDSNRRRAGRAAMQLNLELFDQNNVPQRASAVWEDLEEAARIAATEALARLIARMLQDQPSTEASDE